MAPRGAGRKRPRRPRKFPAAQPHAGANLAWASLQKPHGNHNIPGCCMLAGWCHGLHLFAHGWRCVAHYRCGCCPCWWSVLDGSMFIFASAASLFFISLLLVGDGCWRVADCSWLLLYTCLLLRIPNLQQGVVCPAPPLGRANTRKFPAAQPRCRDEPPHAHSQTHTGMPRSRRDSPRPQARPREH